MHDADLQRVIDRAEDLLRAIEEDADDTTRRVVFELLQHIDTIHREGLARLRAMLRAAGHESILEKSSDDFAVRVLLELYDMQPRPKAASAPGVAAARPPTPGRSGFVSLESIGIGPVEGKGDGDPAGGAAREPGAHADGDANPDSDAPSEAAAASDADADSGADDPR